MSSHDYPELDLALADQAHQADIYKPTAFWAGAIDQLVGGLRDKGMDSFRSQPGPLGYFVPTFGSPGNGIPKDWVEKALANVSGPTTKGKKTLEATANGYLHAEADFRTLVAADDPNRLPALHTFSESPLFHPAEQFEFHSRRFSRSSLNYLLGLVFLKKHLGNESFRTVLEIGGGFGTLGEILAASGIEGWKYIDIDIPPTHFFAQSYLKAALPDVALASYADTREMDTIAIDQLPPLSVLCSWQIERLVGSIDLFVNFISFQEMEPAVVDNYLRQVDRLQPRWVLLRNIREGKPALSENRGPGVETPIKSGDYLQMLKNYRLVESNVIPFGHRTVDGFHSELMLFHRER